jgi:ketosteroid isomerase-like protein
MEANTAAVRACLEIVSQASSDGLDRLVAPDYVLHDPALPEDVRGADGLRALSDEYRRALGRHQGELLGVPPSGREIAFSGVTISRCRDGTIVEEWEICDTLGLLQQLGALSATVESPG